MGATVMASTDSWIALVAGDATSLDPVKRYSKRSGMAIAPITDPLPRQEA